MLFNSSVYIFFFLPLMVVGYYLLCRYKLITASKAWLILGSLFFYSWWDMDYLPLILFSILFNYTVGSTLARLPSVRVNKKLTLAFGIAVNLTLLGYFKYTDFIILNINAAFSFDMGLKGIVLPLAISFFTFQQIAYLVDSYKGGTREYDFLNYTLFVCFFPQLIAGPIVHHSEMMPQFSRLRNKIPDYRNLSTGLLLLLTGLFKKVAIADSLSNIVAAGFDVSTSLSFIEAWTAALSYTFQIYFDFSGYMDMAMGSALMLNIKLPINFNSPYKSLNIRDFWRRWHITLSRFLRDHLYIPLGGSRRAWHMVFLNILVTFLLGGLWHGAGWTFIFWGFLHGMAIIVNRLWSNTGIRLNRFICWFLTFNFVNIAWVFFRAKQWPDAIKVLKGMFDINSIALPGLQWEKILSFNANIELWQVAALAILIIFTATWKNSNEIGESFRPDLKFAAISVFFGLYSMFSLDQVSEFLYFNF